MNKNYNLNIKVLTPIHIGNGNTISGIDYFCYKEKLDEPYEKTEDGSDIKNRSFLYKFNIQNFINILEPSDKKDFYKLLEMGTDTFEIRNFIYKKLEEEKKIYKDKFIDISKEKIEIKNSFYSLWKEKIKGKIKQKKWKTEEKKENEFTNNLSQLQIQSFIESLGRYYIPGSSLKGALRTILTTKNIQNLHNTDKDPFKKLIVRDSHFINDGVSIGKLARQSNKGEGQYIEFLKPGVSINTEIIFKKILNENELEIVDFSKENIISSSNIYIKKKLESYVEELFGLKNLNKKTSDKKTSEMKDKKIDSVVDSFNKILVELNNLQENEFILNIGFGGGFWFKSFEGDEKHPKKHGILNLKDDLLNIPRTSNNIDLENLGFIKCSFTN